MQPETTDLRAGADPAWSALFKQCASGFPLDFFIASCQHVDMVCPYCSGRTKVVNSRRQKRNNNVWRRRHCSGCSAVFTSIESPNLSSTLIVNQNGTYKPFLTDLLYTEILLTISDRKDCYIAARELTNSVIQFLLRSPQKPVFTPTDINQAVAGVLKRFSKRAWQRYSAEHESLQAKTN